MRAGEEGAAHDDGHDGAERADTKEEEPDFMEAWALQEPNYGLQLAPRLSCMMAPVRRNLVARMHRVARMQRVARMHRMAWPLSSLQGAWLQGLGQSHHGEVEHGTHGATRAGAEAGARARPRASHTEAIVVGVAAMSRRAKARARATSAGRAMMRRIAGTTMVLHQRVIWHIYLLDFNT